MCGLVAVINKNSNGFTTEQNDVFSTLLFVDVLRGDDSTGVMCVTNDGDLKLAKEASDSLRFMRSKEYNELMNRSYSRGSALIGHNRKATRGVVTDENAHPFVVDDNIVLVHNGTLLGDWKKHADVEVDSNAIAHLIHKEGDVEKALNKIDGAYALIWYDVAKGSVNLIRNSQRPLWWMETHNAWYFCSERSMLNFAAERHTLNLKERPTEFPENLHQTFTLRKNGGWDSDNTKVKIATKSYTSYSTGQSQHWGLQPTRPRHQQQHPLANRYFHGADDDGVLEDANTPFPVQKRETKDPVPLRVNERRLAKSMNKFVTNKEYQTDVLRSFHVGMKVLCEPFDYIEGPFKDGYYLYSSPLENPELIVKHFFSNKHTTEERVLQLASGDYVFEFSLGTIEWVPFADKNIGEPFLPDEHGAVIIGSGKAELIYGGGVGDKDAVEKRKRVTH